MKLLYLKVSQQWVGLHANIKYLKANPNDFVCFFEQEGYKQHHPYQVLVYQSKDEGTGVPGQEEGPSVDDDSQGSSCTWKISLIEKCKT